GPLTAEDTRQLVQRLGAAEPDQQFPAFGEWLFRETGGQPFFMTETLKALHDRGALISERREDGAWGIRLSASIHDEDLLRSWLPPSVRDVIRHRLGWLSSTAQALLSAAAVLGQGFTFERLCDVAGLREDEGLPALDEALRARLLREQAAAGGDTPTGSYSFVHDRIRDVAYAEASEARRRVLHRRALEALERAGHPPAALARHAVGAGLPERAFALTLAAGDEAMDLFAVADAS